jgi:hypothetical protein
MTGSDRAQADHFPRPDVREHPRQGPPRAGRVAGGGRPESRRVPLTRPNGRSPRAPAQRPRWSRRPLPHVSMRSEPSLRQSDRAYAPQRPGEGHTDSPASTESLERGSVTRPVSESESAAAGRFRLAQ